MIDKYFGFKTVTNEHTIIESLIEHSRIDEQELFLLHKMINSLCDGDLDDVAANHANISKIRQDSNHIFEQLESQIIQSHFDFQKQHDLLRIYQRIEDISNAIVDCSYRIVLCSKLQASIPEGCCTPIRQLMNLVLDQHARFHHSLKEYETNKSSLINTIHEVIRLEEQIKKQYFVCLEALYMSGNDGSIPIGHFRAIENIIEHAEQVGYKTQHACTGLEWLLIN